MARNEKLLIASRNVLEPGAIRTIITNKKDVEKYLGITINGVVQCSSTEDTDYKQDIKIKCPNGIDLNGQVKTREYGNSNFSFPDDELDKNAFTIFYEKDFSENDLDNFIGPTSSDLMILGEKIYLLSIDQLKSCKVVLKKENYKVYEYASVLENSLHLKVV